MDESPLFPQYRLVSEHETYLHHHDDGVGKPSICSDQRLGIMQHE